MKTLTHKFVESLPEPLEEGVIYVSVRFRLTAHKCCCGCGHPVILNLAPDGWRMTFDGKSVTLYPSIGNWTLPCRSHYWISKNTVEWAEAWSPAKVKRAVKGEARELQRVPSSREPPHARKHVFQKLKRFFLRE